MHWTSARFLSKPGGEKWNVGQLVRSKSRLLEHVSSFAKHIEGYRRTSRTRSTWALSSTATATSGLTCSRNPPACPIPRSYKFSPRLSTPIKPICFSCSVLFDYTSLCHSFVSIFSSSRLVNISSNTEYIKKQDEMTFLSAIASYPSGSQLVFDYLETNIKQLLDTYVCMRFSHLSVAKS